MLDTSLDIEANRRAQKWAPKELLGRFVWEILERPLFRWTPRQLWWWRRFVLRIFGARIGRSVQIHPSARIAIPWNLEIGDYSAIGDHAIVYCLGPIRIGNCATISQYAHLCAGSHDFRQSDMPLIKAHITIADEVWVCANAFIGPNIVLGARAIVAAAAVVVRDVDANHIVGGNPATQIATR
jgi:putative colanic acid biosynthesis acetyltransferase WcaF